MEAIIQQSNSDPNRSSHCTHTQRQHRHGHRFGKAALIVVLAIAGGFVGGFANKAMAQDHKPMMAEGDGGDKGARMDKHIERMVKHMAIELDATPEQQTKLIAIAKGAIKDMMPMREKHQAARQRGMA